MSFIEPRRYAENAPTWTADDWWRLEAHLFADHPRVRLALGLVAPAPVRPLFARKQFAPLQTLLALTQLASIALPVVAFATLVSRFFNVDGTVDVGRAGLLAGIAAIFALIGLVGNIRRPEEVDPRTVRRLGWIHIIASAATAALSIAALASGAAVGAVGILGFVADIAVGIALVVMTPIPKDEQKDRSERFGLRLRRAIEQIPPVQAVAIAEEREAAIAVLRARGLIDEATAERAHRTPTGALAFSMTESAQSTN